MQKSVFKKKAVALINCLFYLVRYCCSALAAESASNTSRFVPRACHPGNLWALSTAWLLYYFSKIP